MKRIIILAAFVLSTGCVSQAAFQAKRDEFNRTLPLGDSKPECEAKWEAAQVWVAQNIAANIQTATPVLIQTAGSVGTYLAARVVKEPRYNNGCVIRIWIYCGNAYGICYPDSWDAAIAFNRTVGAVGPSSTEKP